MPRVLLALLALCPTLVVADPSVTDKLKAAESLWERKAPAEYEFTFNFSELILPKGCGDGRFLVKVVGVEPVRRTDCRKMRITYSTVPQQFRAIRAAIALRHTDVTADFDPTLGYPTAFYSGDPGIEDAYFSFSVTDFRAFSDVRAPN